MALLSWRKEYAVGVTAIDSEHRYLFTLINEFYDRHTAGSDRRDVLQVLNRLVAYAEEHFHHEEALMSSHAYPHLAEHHGWHEELFLSIFTLNEKLAAGVQSIDRDTMQFLKHWLVGHILKNDMDFSEFLQRKVRSALRASESGKAERPPPQSSPDPAAQPVATEEASQPASGDEEP